MQSTSLNINFFNTTNRKALFTGLFSLILAFSFSSVHAQKYGHLNLGNLLADLPEMAAAQKNLETYQTQLTNKGKQMVEKLQADIKKLEADYQGLAPVVAQERQVALQKDEQAILKYEQEVIALVQQKRQELLEPILTKVQTAIDEVATAGNYVMIFDTSVFNAIVYAKESEDVLALVKAKL